MEGLKESLHEIIAEVLKGYDLSQITDSEKSTVVTVPPPAEEKLGPGIFSSMESAVQAAVIAQRELIQLPLSKRKEIIQAIRDTIIKNRDELSANAAEETGFGRKEDKVIKHILAASKTPGSTRKQCSIK